MFILYLRQHALNCTLFFALNLNIEIYAEYSAVLHVIPVVLGVGIVFHYILLISMHKELHCFVVVP